MSRARHPAQPCAQRHRHVEPSSTGRCGPARPANSERGGPWASLRIDRRHQRCDTCRRVADDLRVADVCRLRSEGRCARRPAPPRGRRGDTRQDQLSRICGRRQHVQRRIRPHSKSVGHHQVGRRLDRRRGRRACDGHDRVRGRHRPWWIAPHPGCILRHYRIAAVGRPRADVSDGLAVGYVVGDRADGPYCRGCGVDAPGDRRAIRVFAVRAAGRRPRFRSRSTGGPQESPHRVLRGHRRHRRRPGRRARMPECGLCALTKWLWCRRDSARPFCREAGVPVAARIVVRHAHVLAARQAGSVRPERRQQRSLRPRGDVEGDRGRRGVPRRSLPPVPSAVQRIRSSADPVRCRSALPGRAELSRHHRGQADEDLHRLDRADIRAEPDGAAGGMRAGRVGCDWYACGIAGCGRTSRRRKRARAWPRRYRNCGLSRCHGPARRGLP